jgi:hypothetical protein
MIDSGGEYPSVINVIEDPTDYSTIVHLILPGLELRSLYFYKEDRCMCPNFLYIS